MREYSKNAKDIKNERQVFVACLNGLLASVVEVINETDVLNKRLNEFRQFSNSNMIEDSDYIFKYGGKTIMIEYHMIQHYCIKTSGAISLETYDDGIERFWIDALKKDVYAGDENSILIYVPFLVGTTAKNITQDNNNDCFINILIKIWYVLSRLKDYDIILPISMSYVYIPTLIVPIGMCPFTSYSTYTKVTDEELYQSYDASEMARLIKLKGMEWIDTKKFENKEKQGEEFAKKISSLSKYEANKIYEVDRYMFIRSISLDIRILTIGKLIKYGDKNLMRMKEKFIETTDCLIDNEYLVALPNKKIYIFADSDKLEELEFKRPDEYKLEIEGMNVSNKLEAVKKLEKLEKDKFITSYLFLGADSEKIKEYNKKLEEIEKKIIETSDEKAKAEKIIEKLANDIKIFRMIQKK